METASPWHLAQHPRDYNYLAGLPVWMRRRFYARYNEMALLPVTAPVSILEVGCATGEVALYLHDRYPTAAYTGTDISRHAVAVATRKFPPCRGLWPKDHAWVPSFWCGDFRDIGRKDELVFCRDVVHHQDDPLAFLTALYAKTSRYLLVRLRTTLRRDSIRGCQTINGLTVPYWVLSEHDLRRWSRTLTPLAAVTVFEHPKVCQSSVVVPNQYEHGIYAETAMVLDKRGPDKFSWRIQMESPLPFWLRTVIAINRRRRAYVCQA